MNYLSQDMSRCAGRFDFLPDTPPCGLRQECARYRQIFVDRENGQNGHHRIIMHCYQDDKPTLYIPTAHEEPHAA